MIATLAEIKTIIGISQSDTSKDSTIKTFMQIIEEEIHDICKNDFLRERDLINEKYLSSSLNISFEASSYKILDSDNNFDTAFIAGDSIKVFGSLYNDGIYLVDTVAVDGSYLTIDSDYGSITDEASGVSAIGIYKLWYPKPLKFAIAHMINYRLSSDSLLKSKGIESERVDDYNVKFETGKGSKLSGYSSDILKMLQPYRKYY